MNRTEKTDSVMPAEQIECLRGRLQTSFEKLRGGKDADGLESLASFILDLGEFVENDQNSQKPQIDMGRLLAAVGTLYFYIKNQDIAGITDLLEDVFYPMIEGWMKGSDDI